MRIRSNVVALLSSLVLFACGGAASQDAKGPEGDPWADYKGTFATKGEPRTKSSEKSESAKSEAKAKADTNDDKVEEASAAPVAKKASKGMIRGESISSIGADALADASKSASKSKVVSSKVVVGSQYEQVNVQLKGVAVQITRPAANPDPNGPSVSSPKARNNELSKTESGWYDEDADVLVVVGAGKKAGSQKMLGTILKR